MRNLTLEFSPLVRLDLPSLLHYAQCWPDVLKELMTRPTVLSSDLWSSPGSSRVRTDECYISFTEPWRLTAKLTLAFVEFLFIYLFLNFILIFIFVLFIHLSLFTLQVLFVCVMPSCLVLLSDSWVFKSMGLCDAMMKMLFGK